MWFKKFACQKHTSADSTCISVCVVLVLLTILGSFFYFNIIGEESLSSATKQVISPPCDHSSWRFLEDASLWLTIIEFSIYSSNPNIINVFSFLALARSLLAFRVSSIVPFV